MPDPDEKVTQPVLPGTEGAPKDDAEKFKKAAVELEETRKKLEEVEAKRIEAEARAATIAEEARRREAAASGAPDPQRILQAAADQVVLAARDPNHPNHAAAVMQLAMAQEIRDDRNRRAAQDAKEREEGQLGKIPEQHRKAVQDFLKDHRDRFADPDAVYGYLRGIGTLKPTDDEQRKEDERRQRERAGAAPNMPGASGAAGDDKGGEAEAQEMKRSEYQKALRDNPSQGLRLRNLRDSGKLVLVDG